MKQKKIESIQFLRCIAALLVCCMHLARNESVAGYFFSILQQILSIVGTYGVDLFFAISGFIMSWIVLHQPSMPSVTQGIVFFIKRIFRIYPLFWFTLGVMMILSLLINGMVNSEVQQALQGTVLLLLTPHIPLQYAAWSLPYELYFYVTVFVFVCLFKKRYFIPFFTIWMLFHLILIYLSSYGVVALKDSIFINIILLEFFVGLIVGYIYFKYPCVSIIDKYVSLLTGCAILIFGFVGSYLSILPANNWIFCLVRALPVGLIIYGVVGLELQTKVKFPKFITKLGDISYSIYLWHFPMLGIVSFINSRWHFYQEFFPFARFLIEVIAVILISFASYRWIEWPFIRLSHRIANKLR